MTGANENRCVELCKKSVENEGTPAEVLLLAKAIECEGNLVKYSNEGEHRKVLLQFQTALDDIEDKLASHFLFGPDKETPPPVPYFQEDQKQEEA